ncbi:MULTISPECIES: hypothetical protein [Metallosphaera]|uniref:hypothetical protein n=1 Tax=Metallosphaera TaxID=41980 RepID=UPI0031692BB1
MNIVSIASRKARGVRTKAKAAADVMKATVSQAGAMAAISWATASNVPTTPLLSLGTDF